MQGAFFPNISVEDLDHTGVHLLDTESVVSPFRFLMIYFLINPAVTVIDSRSLLVSIV